MMFDFAIRTNNTNNSSYGMCCVCNDCTAAVAIALTTKFR